MKIERKKLPKLAYGFVYETKQISPELSWLAGKERGRPEERENKTEGPKMKRECERPKLKRKREE